MELFLPILGDNSRKSHWNWQVWLQNSLSNLVRSFSDVESQKRCQPLTNAFGGMGWYAWNWLSHYNVNATISRNNENLNSLQESAPFMGNREKSQASGMQKETQKQGARKESGSSSFPLPSQVRHSLAHSFATQNGEDALSPIRWTSIKIRPIYILSNVHYGSMSPFSTKNPHIHVVQRHPSVPSHGILFNLVTLTCFSPLLHLLSLITNSDTVI